MQKGTRVIFKKSFERKYRRRKKYRQLKKIIFPVLILIAAVGFSYFIFFSSFFKITGIKINGAKTLKADAIMAEIQKNFQQKSLMPKNNWFLLNEESIRADILNLFPQIASIKINKQFPRSLDAIIQEREMIGIYCGGQVTDGLRPTDYGTNAINEAAGGSEPVANRQNCFYIDGNGIIFEEAPQGSGSLVFTIKDFSGNRDFKIGREIIKKDFLDKLNLIKELLTKEANINTREAELMTGGDIRIKSDQNFIIYFDSNRDIQNQILALREILTQKITPGDKVKLEYIDLRVEGRVYYK